MAKKLYVGNLDFSTTDAVLRELFAEVGEVVSVNLVTDRMTGRSRGFAFVEMAEASAAKSAIEQLNGRTVGERSIKVDEARPRRQQDSPWGGGGGGGGDRRRRF